MNAVDARRQVGGREKLVRGSLRSSRGLHACSVECISCVAFRAIDIGPKVFLRNARCFLNCEYVLRRKMFPLIYPTPYRSLRNTKNPTKRRLRTDDFNRYAQSLCWGWDMIHAHEPI